MPRIARMVVEGQKTAYHVISRTALDGFVLRNEEKEHLLKLIKHMSRVYFTEVVGFCIMGNHFHLLATMKPSEDYSDSQVRQRLRLYYGDDRVKFTGHQLPMYRLKLESLSQYVRDIKQRFSRYYNKRHGRKGYFWGDRFKSVIVEQGETLINCLAYIDLNPVRAGLVKTPDEYRWCSMGYHVQSGNKDGFLSTDYGLDGAEKLSAQERFSRYGEFVYENGGLKTQKGKSIEIGLVDRQRKKGYQLTPVDRLRYRTRYFTDSGIIGTKAYVQRFCKTFKELFSWKRDRNPKRVAGLESLYSLKRLSEQI